MDTCDPIMNSLLDPLFDSPFEKLFQIIKSMKFSIPQRGEAYFV